MLALALQAGLILSPTPVFAQVDINNVFKGPFTDLGTLISALLPNILTLAGVILLFLLIFGGFSYIINAGKGDSQGAGKGKDMITWAIVGFILIFAAYWIMEIISYITGIQFFKSAL